MADKLVIKIDGDDSGFQKSFAGIEGVAKKGLGVAVKGVAAIGTGFTIATGAALKFSGELEQNLGGSEAVFGEFADNIQKKADDAFKNMGLSTSKYLATANKMGALFKGAGFEVEEAMNLSSETMQRAADVASIMGLDTSMAMESIAGAAKGNFTMMDNLGVAMNDTTLNAYALEKGLGKTTQQMTNQEKIGLAMEMFLDRTAYAAGNYAKENETLAGSLNTAKAALENYLSGAGDPKELEQALKNASEVIVKNIKDLAPGLAEGLIEIVKGLIPVIPEVLVELLPSILDTIEELFNEGAEMLPEFINKLADGIGDAVPILTPITSLISLLADNMDVLTVAVIAATSAVVTYKGALLTMSIIQQVTSWIDATTKAYIAYNAAVAASGNVGTLLLTTLTPLQLIFGVLHKKITLAEAAQVKFNLTVLKNPYVLAAAAIAALVAAVVGYAVTHKSKATEIMESLDEMRESYEKNIKSIDKNTEAAKADGEMALTLKDRLYELEGQLRSNTLTQQEAEQVQQEFNATASELEKLIPGIKSEIYDETGAINIQKNAVDGLCQSYKALTIAKAKSEAYYEKIKEATSAQIDAKEKYDEAVANYEEKKKTAKTQWEVNVELTQADEAVQAAAKDWLKYDADVEKLTQGYTEVMAEYAKEVEKLSKKTTEKLEENNNERVTSTKTTSKKETDILKEQAKEELRTLESKHKQGTISDEDYYRGLAEIRNKYFEEGSDDWHDYTEDIYDYYADTLDGITEKAISQIEDIKEAQESLEENLKQGANRTYEQYSIVEKGEETTYTRLADTQSSAQELATVNQLLDRVKEKWGEDLPDSLSESLTSMDVADMNTYLTELLTASEEEFAAYMDGLKKLDEESKKLSSNIMSTELDNLKTSLEEQFGQLPEEFFDIGEESAEQYGEGFMEVLATVLEKAKTSISSVLSNLSSNLVVAGAGGANVSNYTDARTTTIIAPSTSSHDIVEAQKQNETFEEHTKGFGG